MSKGIALFISYFLHPLLMPTYFFGVLLLVAPDFFRPLNDEQALEIVLRLSVVTLLLPTLSISILKFTGNISSIHLAKQKERLMPYLFTAVYYGVLTYIFYQGLSFHAFFVVMSSILLLILALVAINFWIKVSAHASGITGVLGFLWALKLSDAEEAMLYPIVAIIVVSGLVMSARLKLNAHNPLQVYLGALIGFTICFCGAYFFL